MKTLIFKSGLGWIGLGATVGGVAAVVLPKPTRGVTERELKKLILAIHSDPSFTSESLAPARHLKAARGCILAYLEGKARHLDLALDLTGHPRFRLKVWAVLQTIPYGRVRSYGWVARKIGKPKAARAVGGACGANPIPLLVPCHRVIAGDGSLGGFSGGLAVKKRLLALEGILVSTPRRRDRTITRPRAREAAGA